MAAEDCCLGRGVAALRHNSGSSSFTYYSICAIQPSIAAFDHDGTVFGAINKGQLENISAIAPVSGLIAAFHENAEAFDQRIRESIRQVQTLTEIRDKLLPKLFSGELRIADAEKRIAVA